MIHFLYNYNRMEKEKYYKQAHKQIEKIIPLTPLLRMIFFNNLLKRGVNK